MRINSFGNLRISLAGHPVTAVNTNRLQSLIAYLILHGDAPRPRERLAFLLWPSAVEEGPRVAVISGEPGIGKTRLADELYEACVRQGHAINAAAVTPHRRKSAAPRSAKQIASERMHWRSLVCVKT
jgi:hypothetical protein